MKESQNEKHIYFLGVLIAPMIFLGWLMVLDWSVPEFDDTSVVQNIPKVKNQAQKRTVGSEVRRTFADLVGWEEPVPEIEPPQPKTNERFGRATVKAEQFLSGPGKNIDSPEFWQERNGRLHLFVSGKSNNTIEKWTYPFTQRAPQVFDVTNSPNGLDVDQRRNWLLVGDADNKNVDVYSLPVFTKVKTLGKGKFDDGETNVDILSRGGSAIAYISEDEKIIGFNLDSGERIHTIKPNVDEVEEVLADSFHNVIYVPEEDGAASAKHPGGAVLAFNPDGSPYIKRGTNTFGNGVFSGDEEGIALYACRDEDGRDNGHGFIVVSDQNFNTQNNFEFFDRISWRHLGALSVSGVTGTDGIAFFDKPLENYPSGLFAAINNDTNTALVDMTQVFTETGLGCFEN